MLTIRVLAKRLVALCDPDFHSCTVDHGYAIGAKKPHYPMPAINGPTYIGKYGIYQSFADLECYEPQQTWTR